MDAIASASLKILSDFEAQSLANTAWAYAKLEFAPFTQLPCGRGLLEAISWETIRKIDQFHNQGMANTVWAYATLA